MERALYSHSIVCIDTFVACQCQLNVTWMHFIPRSRPQVPIISFIPLSVIKTYVQNISANTLIFEFKNLLTQPYQLLEFKDDRAVDIFRDSSITRKPLWIRKYFALFLWCLYIKEVWLFKSYSRSNHVVQWQLTFLKQPEGKWREICSVRFYLLFSSFFYFYY